MSAYSKQFILFVGLFIVAAGACSAQTLMLTLQVGNVNQAIKGQIPQGKNYFEITPNEVYNGIKIESGNKPGPRLTATDTDKFDLLELSNIVFANTTNVDKIVNLDFKHEFAAGPSGKVLAIDYVNGFFVGTLLGSVSFQGDVAGDPVEGTFQTSFDRSFDSKHKEKQTVGGNRVLHGNLRIFVQPNSKVGINVAGVGIVPEPSSFAAGCLAVIGTSILALRRTRRKSGVLK